MKRKSLSLPSAEGNIVLRGFHWMPEGEVKAVFQLCHGMVEHIGRYDEFARRLTEAGFAVVGFDLLGHGKSVNDTGERGFFAEQRGEAVLLKDMRRITYLVKKLHPGKAVFLLGHSMGSFLSRRYITLYGEEIDGLVLSGSGNVTLQEARLGLRLSDFYCRHFGKHSHSRLLNLLTLGQYALQFGWPWRPGSWLSRNKASVAAYAADPACGYAFTAGAYRDFFRLLVSLAEEKQFDRIPRELPVLLMSGMEDPVGGFSKGVLAVYNRFVELGMKDLDIYLYRDDRHEILQELDRKQVFSDVIAWAEKRTGR